MRHRLTVGPANHSRILAAISAIIAVMAFAVLAYAVKAGTPLRYDDEQQYVEIAQNIVDGKGFRLDGELSAYRPPAWPLVIAAFLWLGLPTSLLALIPAVALISAAVVAAMLGVRLARTPWGALAGVAMLSYPLNIYTAVTMYPQALATLLLMTLWWLALSLSQEPADGARRSRVQYMALGLAAALLALSVPTLAFTGVAVLAWTLCVVRGDRIRAVAFAGSALAVPVAAWTIRNLVTLGAPIPLSSSSGLNLLIGNNATATGSSGTSVNIDEPLRAAAAMSEVDADRHFQDTALAWITQHPLDALTLYAAKVANYFSPYNEPVTATANSGAQRIVAYLSCAVLLVLLASRLLLRRRLPLDATERLMLWLFLLNALVMAVFFTRTRFRQPLDSILLVEAVLGLILLVAAIRTARRGST
ncbi:hypothetical protein [Mycolicibacterium confluentis]|uniref:Uncharacterized protein n=1 Tax=Mycolicibacterium confluentis TaxID=28047 RepID=A0A7I7XZW4_9MYCO|nr:hypothetical protein [Mycolicibacterium confluentis]MCV7319846.1 hypothetical protein [Mycolicibacterium confluentis]ORV34419.1 hypothetical protein AWB99_02020 [Mycolicibacterium confluentis]BBZ34876.1 hypothetical protein MCNF_34810 [Mycolicibacterium confluentis]